MPVTSEIASDSGAVTIRVSGRFDFAVQNEFRDCYYNSTNNQDELPKFIIDMSGTNYMDSSALGMLLMMREYLGGNSADITIANSSADIKNILTVANFQSLFNMT